jgi:hypothetical protein
MTSPDPATWSAVASAFWDYADYLAESANKPGAEEVRVDLARRVASALGLKDRDHDDFLDAARAT